MHCLSQSELLWRFGAWSWRKFGKRRSEILHSEVY